MPIARARAAACPLWRILRLKIATLALISRAVLPISLHSPSDLSFSVLPMRPIAVSSDPNFARKYSLAMLLCNLLSRECVVGKFSKLNTKSAYIRVHNARNQALFRLTEILSRVKHGSCDVIGSDFRALEERRLRSAPFPRTFNETEQNGR